MPSEVGTTFTLNLFLFPLLMLLFGLASQVFLALCVYHDARFRGNDNAALWGVLSGVFTLAALIYLIVALTSRPQPKPCYRCGNWVYPGMPTCPVCGLESPLAMSPEAAERYRKNRRLFLILWLVTLAAMIVCVVAFFSMAISYAWRYWY